MLKILIVDDHAVVRNGLRHFLAAEGDCRIAGDAASGTEAMAQTVKELKKNMDPNTRLRFHPSAKLLR